MLESEFDVLADGRSLGLLSAIEFDKDRKTGERFETPKAPQVVEMAGKLGLICWSVTYVGTPASHY